MPAPFRPRAALVGCLLLAPVLAGCSGDDLPTLNDAGAQACADAMESLPSSIFGQHLDEVDGRRASYGEVTLTCGVEMPEDYAETAECSEVAGVGWFVPPQILSDLGQDLVAYALTRDPVVRIEVPAQDRLEETDSSLAALAEPLSAHLAEGLTCL